MLLQVPLITESLSTEVAENLLEGWQSTSFPLVSLFMTAMVKDVTYVQNAKTDEGYYFAHLFSRCLTRKALSQSPKSHLYGNSPVCRYM